MKKVVFFGCAYGRLLNEHTLQVLIPSFVWRNHHTKPLLPSDCKGISTPDRTPNSSAILPQFFHISQLGVVKEKVLRWGDGAPLTQVEWSATMFCQKCQKSSNISMIFISVENEMKIRFRRVGRGGGRKECRSIIGSPQTRHRERARWWPKGFLPERNLQPKFARE